MFRYSSGNTVAIFWLTAVHTFKLIEKERGLHGFCFLPPLSLSNLMVKLADFTIQKVCIIYEPGVAWLSPEFIAGLNTTVHKPVMAIA